MTSTIGIDLGTFSSAVARYDDGQPVILNAMPDEHFAAHPLASSGYDRQPFPDAATAAKALSPVVQLLGRSFDDAIVQVARKHLAFDLHRGADDNVLVALASRTRAITVDELVTKMLRRLKERTESYSGAHIAHTVLAVPAHFESNQRRAVRRAAEEAGLNVLQLVDAPTAASLAFGQRYGKQERKLLLAIDLDRGHLDISLLRLEQDSATVLAQEGEAALGHAAWAARIADFLAQRFLRKHGVDLRHDAQARLRLQMAADEACTHLLESDDAVVDLPFISSGAHSPHHLNMILTRQVYDVQTASLRERLEQAIANVFRRANLEPHLVDDILLLGSGAAQPALLETVGKAVGSTPRFDDDRRELVVLGAALQAMRSITREERASARDVTRLGLGLETVGGLMTTIIPRNTPLPARRVEIFSTSEDNQTDVEIAVLQGERPLAEDNNRLGVVRVQGIPEAPRGTPQIEVAFEVSAEGILQVTARDLATEARESLTVDMNEVICDGDAHRIVEEARVHEADDLHKRAVVETRNLGRQTIYQTKRYLQHLNGVGGREGCERARREVEGILHALQKAIEAHDVEKIQELTGKLQAAGHYLNNLAYGRAAASGAVSDTQAGTNRPDSLEIAVEEL